MRKNSFFLLLFFAVLSSCVKENDRGVTAVTSITATLAEPQTKTELGGSTGTEMLWSPSDEISVFYLSDNSYTENCTKFVSTNTVPAKTAAFVSDCSTLFCGTENADGWFCGIYPYHSQLYSFNENAAVLSVSGRQYAVDGDLPRSVLSKESDGTQLLSAYPAIGRSKTTDIAFYNVCGGIRFTLSEGNVQKVEFTGNNSEILAGRVTVEFDGEGHPGVKAVLDTVRTVSLNAPDTNGFRPGVWYYASILPTKLDKGLNVKIKKRSDCSLAGERNIAVPLEIKRSTFGSINDIDKNVSFKVNVTALTLSHTLLSMDVGETAELNCAWSPSDAVVESLVWSSSNENVAVVDQNGKVTANGCGYCFIAVQSDNGVRQECYVEVDKWNYLGKAEFWDLWLWGDINEAGYMVDMYQSEYNRDRYRLVEPYKDLWEDAGSAYIAGGWELTTPASKIEFQVMRAGQMIHGGIEGVEMKITSDGPIYYSPIKMGLNNPYYGAEVYSYNPADLGSTAGDEANLVWNKVANWQDSGLPSVAYLAGNRYMPDIGGFGGWDSPNEAIVVRFPGGVFEDFSLEVSTGEASGGKIPFTFTTGNSIDEIHYCIYDSYLSNKEISVAKAMIEAKAETKEKVIETGGSAGEYTCEFSCETTSLHTIVAVGFDKNGNAKSSASVMFAYVKPGDDEKVKVVAGVTLEFPSAEYQAAGYSPNNNLMFTLYGKDIKSASIKLVTAEDFNTDADSCWTLVQTVDEEIVASINKAGGYTGIHTSLNPETEYVLLAEFNNGYQVAQYTDTCTTDGSAPVKKATGTYTLSAFFSGDIPGVELYFDPNTEQSYYLKDYVGWGSDFNFEWVAATDSLIIPTPQLMTSDSNYGAIYFGEVLDFTNYVYGSNAPAAIAFYEANGLEITSIAGTSRYVKDSTMFKFAVGYYATAGYFGTGVETYQIDPSSRTLKKISSTDIHWVKAMAPSVKLNPNKIVWKLPYVERPLKPSSYTVGPVVKSSGSVVRGKRCRVDVTAKPIKEQEFRN